MLVNLAKTKRNLLFVPRSKHFPLRLWCIQQKSLSFLRYFQNTQRKSSTTYIFWVFNLLIRKETARPYLLTYSMVQSPWVANWFAAGQEIPRILWNLSVHYCTHKPPPPVPILGQPNPAHIPTSHLLEIHPNIIHPSTPKSPQWSLSHRFPHQDPINPPLLTHKRHMSNPSHSNR